ncbi:MAG: hypothetical protein OWT28_13080 [Firmicutes bacterium]|nr:hypothetical protein [Bacillota bacterium]
MRLSVPRLAVTTALAACGLSIAMWAIDTSQGYSGSLMQTVSPETVSRVQSQLRAVQKQEKTLRSSTRQLQADSQKVQANVQSHLEKLAQEGLITLSQGGG